MGVRANRHPKDGIEPTHRMPWTSLCSNLTAAVKHAEKAGISHLKATGAWPRTQEDAGRDAGDRGELLELHMDEDTSSMP